MSRLPNRFDLFVRQAKRCPEPARQADYILGALAALKEWYFINLGATDAPQAAKTVIESQTYLLVFSDADRIEDALRERSPAPAPDPLPVITVSAAAALAWCIECQTGLFVNPPEDAVLIPFAHLEIFYAEWTQRGDRQSAGFWIPNMTSEEEDFWQEHGL
jgi:hypothetical protein